MKIYTKNGDKGKTATLASKNIYKNDPILCLLGTIDELVVLIGMCACIPDPDKQTTILRDLQRDLMNISSFICSDYDPIYDTSQMTAEILELHIDSMTDDLPPLRNFILPSTSINNGYIHLARVKTRECERLFVEHQGSRTDDALEKTSKFLNRLSDYLFTLARYNTDINNEQEYIL